jgi:hypothetical protein
MVIAHNHLPLRLDFIARTIFPRGAISSGIDPLVEQIYGILCGSLLQNIQRIRNISKMEAKDRLTEWTGAFDACCDAGTPALSSTSSMQALSD